MYGVVIWRLVIYDDITPIGGVAIALVVSKPALPLPVAGGLGETLPLSGYGEDWPVFDTGVAVLLRAMPAGIFRL